MADLITLAPSRPIDWAGDISPGAKATFYLSGTTTPATVYQDEAGTIPHASPVVADGDGVFPPIFSTSALRAVITDADDVEIPGSPLDPCPRTLTTQSGAGTIPFSPTEDIPASNVQDAIEQVQANQNEGLEAAGVGVKTAPLLANIDATNLASGRFRYDGTTGGTFPAGVTAADTGTVILSAGASGNAMMELTSYNGLVTAFRMMEALAWGAWQSRPIGKASTAEAQAGANDAKFMTAAAAKAAITFQGLGGNQTWQDMTGSRASGVSYQNTSGKPIHVCIRTTAIAGNNQLEVSSDGVTWIVISITGAGPTALFSANSAVIPIGGYYKYTGSIAVWAELR